MSVILLAVIVAAVLVRLDEAEGSCEYVTHPCHHVVKYREARHLLRLLTAAPAARARELTRGAPTTTTETLKDRTDTGDTVT